jgi:hydroxypyruvate isomerase
MTCAVANGPSTIPDGFNRVENHDRLEAELARMLPVAKGLGIPNMVVFSGNRRGMSDSEGLANCAKGLKRVAPLAERHGVTLVMELLNSKVDHGDYMCDRTPWGAELVQKVGSDRFRLLYDIYHMQIMEGDVIRTIRTHQDAIAHYHTAGNPGRNEIDATQELNYRAICEAIVDLGFTGFLAHEFMPRRDPATSLAEAVAICTV